MILRQFLLQQSPFNIISKFQCLYVTFLYFYCVCFLSPLRPLSTLPRYRISLSSPEQRKSQFLAPAISQEKKERGRNILGFDLVILKTEIFLLQ